MASLPTNLERFLLTLWVGSLWAIGYIAAPVLFLTLPDRQLAGALAGRMFTVVSYLGLACGAVLLLLAVLTAGRRWARSWRLWGLAGMLVLVGVGQFVLHPAMQRLKQIGLTGQTAIQFGQLHEVAALLYGIASVLGLALVVFGPRHKEGT